MILNEYAVGISVPIEPDYVLSPTVIYDDELTGIYFETEDEEYGRITFYNLDSIRICRGEYLPCNDDWTEDKEWCWVYEVQHSSWQIERYTYEKKHYGKAYEFGGNVEDMITEFKHYIFRFHDQFVEVIARGFWWEQDKESLINRPLLKGHPFKDLPQESATFYDAHGYKSQVRTNPIALKKLIEQAIYCPQKLYQFAMLITSNSNVDHTVSITNTNGKIKASLSGFFGRKEIIFDKVPSLEEVLPYIDKYMFEVAGRRKTIK